MSYLLDKKIQRKKLTKYLTLVVFLFIFIYFKSGIFFGLSYISNIIFRPILILGNNIGESLSNSGAYFSSKKALVMENESLRRDLAEKINQLSDHNSVLDENLKIKEILGRKEEKLNLILGSILSKPDQSPYDTLLVDVGSKNGIAKDQKVFAKGNVPIGRVSIVYPNSSKIILYSNPGEKTEVVISGKDNFMQVIGRGGGNFEMLLPRDLVLEKGTEVVLPGIRSSTLAKVETIVSDPRDSFQKALLVSPVNIQELKFVEIEK